MPDTSKLEKLNRELEKSEKKLRKDINDEKVLQHQLKKLTRQERTHRLCTRGGMLESFLQEPERLTDDDVMETVQEEVPGADRGAPPFGPSWPEVLNGRPGADP